MRRTPRRVDRQLKATRRTRRAPLHLSLPVGLAAGQRPLKPPWRGSNPRPGTKTIPLTLTAGERALNAWVLVRIEERERRSGRTWWPWCSGSAWCAVNASVPDRNRPVTQRNKRAVFWEGVGLQIRRARFDPSTTRERRVPPNGWQQGPNPWGIAKAYGVRFVHPPPSGAFDFRRGRLPFKQERRDRHPYAPLRRFRLARPRTLGSQP